MPISVPELADICNDSTPFQRLPEIALIILDPLLAKVSEGTGLARFERATYRLGGGRSILLSYSPTSKL